MYFVILNEVKNLLELLVIQSKAGNLLKFLTIPTIFLPHAPRSQKTAYSVHVFHKVTTLPPPECPHGPLYLRCFEVRSQKSGQNAHIHLLPAQLSMLRMRYHCLEDV